MATYCNACNDEIKLNGIVVFGLPYHEACAKARYPAVDAEARRDIGDLNNSVKRLFERMSKLENQPGHNCSDNERALLAERNHLWQKLGEATIQINKLKVVAERARAVHRYTWTRYTDANGTHNCGTCPLCALHDALEGLNAPVA